MAATPGWGIPSRLHFRARALPQRMECSERPNLGPGGLTASRLATPTSIPRRHGGRSFPQRWQNFQNHCSADLC